MNKNFEELNPVIVSRDFETNKKVAIIMNKLLFKQFPENFVHRSNRLELFFTDKPTKSTFSSYKSNEIKIPLDISNNPFCNIIINTNDQLFRVDYNFEISTDSNGDETGLLRHFQQEGRFEITAKSFLRYAVDEQIPDKYVFANGDNFYRYIKFFEDNINDRVAKMCKIQSFNNPESKVALSIADFYKMCNKGVLEDNKLPSIRATKSLINDLIYMNNSKVEKIQAGILRINKTTGYWGTYRIYFGGTIVCNEFSVNRFKYTFHPGLQLVAKYLESDRKIETLRHKIQKEMFKKM
jgi:hypothetical protein